MKRKRKPFACFFALALVFSLAACGGDSPASAGTSMEDLLQQAQASMESVNSLSYTMTMDMEMTVEDQSMTICTTVDADYILDPMTFKMDMTMDMGEWGDFTTTSYVVSQGTTATMYTGMDVDDSGELTWASQELTDLSVLDQYDATENFELYLSSADSFSEAGTETISGVACTRYDGVIAKDAINQVMEASGMLEQLEEMGLEDASDLLGEMGDLPISIWLSQEDCTPMQYKMDMTEIMTNMMDQLMEEEDTSVTVDSVQVSMTITDLNGLESIEVPAEALAS